MKSARVSALCLLALFLAFSVVFAGDVAKVARVIDGDTIELANGEKVRLIGVDTPETVHPAKAVEYYGKEASEYTKKHLEGRIVRLEYDWQERDKYGRILAYVFLEDSTLFNARLIEAGYAHAYTKYPFKQEYMDLFRALEIEARENKRGLWAGDSTAVDQPTPQRNDYWLNTDSNTLHNATCRWYGNTKHGRYTKEPEGKDCGICGGARAERKSVSPKKATGKYWINSSSNVRHNSSCRWYGNTKNGYYTNEKIGKACGLCGG